METEFITNLTQAITDAEKVLIMLKKRDEANAAIHLTPVVYSPVTDAQSEVFSFLTSIRRIYRIEENKEWEQARKEWTNG